MDTHSSWKLFLLATLLILVPALSLAAEDEKKQAEEPQAEEPEPQQAAGDTITVTGTRIRRKDLNTPAPITVLTRDELKKAGKASIGEVLQQLPSQSNAINTQFNNGGDGSTRVNLRGLASNRTLVLVNGRRHVPGGTGANSSVDLNSIPAAVVERVEVLKDGASAIYGSDAIGGVVNIITRQKGFEGIEAELFFGSTPDGYGTTRDANFTLGQNGQRGFIVFSGGISDQRPMWAGVRDFSRTDRWYDWETGEVTDLGSTATPQGTIVDWSGDGGNPYWQNIAGTSADDTYYNDPVDGWRPFNYDGNSDTGTGDLYNYQPKNYLVTPQTRYHLFSTGAYDLNDYSRAYFEASFSKRQSSQVLAAEPLFTITEGLTVSADNYYNPFGRDFIDVRRRMVEASNRIFTQDINTYTFVGGLDGQLPLAFLQGWFWDVSFNYGLTQGTDINQGRFIRSHVAEALGPSFVDSDGVAHCGTADNPGDPDCVPLNLFGGPGAVTDEMLDWIQYTGTARGFTEQRMLNVNTSGDLFQLWRGPLSLGLGYEFRQDRGAYLPDPITAAGDTTGNKVEPTSGGYAVHSAFAELDYLAMAEAPLVKFFEINAAARAMQYDTFGSHQTWKLGGRWQIIDDIAIRGTRSTAFRSPSIGEMFSGQADSFPAVTDPCDTSHGPRSDVVDQNCSADGLPSDFVDSRTQIRSLVGGNPDLKPETADVFTAGAVIQPRFAKGLSLTMDYFDIQIQNSIQPAGASVLLNNCYSQADRSDCDKIVRDPNTGLISVIVDTETNIGSVHTSGVDVAVRYEYETKVGRFGHNLEGTWLQRYAEEQADGRIIQGKGVYDLGVFPRLRGNLSTVWSYKDLGLGTNMRYVDGFRECEDNDCSVPDALDRNVQPYGTFDLFGSYALRTRGGNSSLVFGVNNVLDREPVRVYNGFAASSDASAYDYLGRYVYFRLTHRL